MFKAIARLVSRLLGHNQPVETIEFGGRRYKRAPVMIPVRYYGDDGKEFTRMEPGYRISDDTEV